MFEINWFDFGLSKGNKACNFKTEYTVNIFTLRGTVKDTLFTIDPLQKKIVFQPVGPFTESELTIVIHGKI